jgi:hypothetical protein
MVRWVITVLEQQFGYQRYGERDAATRHGTVGKMQAGQRNTPGSKVVVLSHILHHLIQRLVFLDIESIAGLPVLIPTVHHGCTVDRLSV